MHECLTYNYSIAEVAAMHALARPSYQSNRMLMSSNVFFRTSSALVNKQLHLSIRRYSYVGCESGTCVSTTIFIRAIASTTNLYIALRTNSSLWISVFGPCICVRAYTTALLVPGSWEQYFRKISKM